MYAEMRFESTRGGCECSYPETLLKGIAPNKGLHMPARWPQFTLRDRRRIKRSRSYHEVAYLTIAPYVDKRTRRALKSVLHRAYTRGTFGGQIVPVKKLEADLYLLKVSQGPTWAFKDMALRLLAELLELWLEWNGQYLNIIVATSGDTGSAAIDALKGRKRLSVTVLSPGVGNMSRAQMKQMYGVHDKKVLNIVIGGDFDDCQAIVKAIMDDGDFVERFGLGLVNSINWTRIIAQAAYFVWAWSRVAKHANDHVAFSVPSGNFGDAFSCFVAKMMGIPIDYIIVATNDNDVLHRFLTTGRYDPRFKEKMKPTLSPSMDIKVGSNLERLLSEAFKRDGHMVSNVMAQAQPKAVGHFDIYGTAAFKRIQEWGFKSVSCSDIETRAAIRIAKRDHGVILDPHTAVAYWAVVARFKLELKLKMPVVIVETARWEKFPETMKSALGYRPPLPQGYRDLMARKTRITRLHNDVSQVKRELAMYLREVA